MTDTFVVVPIPTFKLGITSRLITSFSMRLCVVVFAADTFVDTLVVIWSIVPVTWVCVGSKK